MALLLKLEDFENGADDPQVTDADAQAALPGYAAGYAAGQAAAEDAQNSIDAALVQTLSDMSFGFAEARQHTLHALAPLFHALIHQVLPSVAGDAFHARLVETLITIATAQINGPVRLIVHPDQVQPVAELLPAVRGIEIDLHHDAAIGTHGALISHQSAECTLDLDDLVAQISDVLASIFDLPPSPSQEMPHHG